MKGSRLCAFEILDKVLRKNAYSNISLDKSLQSVEIKDRAFVSSLVYGVIERRLTLDYLISQHLKSLPKPKVKIILYLGAYQLYFMDKVPSSAAVNESVKLASQTGCSYYKGLINAVLHKLDKNRVNLEELSDLSIKYSCPEQLINMWKKQYGEDKTLEILKVINNKPPVFAVPNTLFVNADELWYELIDEGVKGEVVDGVVKINSAFNLNECKAFERGLFHIEDLSSFECALALEAKEGETVVDVCSAPGGKAFTVAERMKNKGKVYAFDLYEHRVKLISEGASRLGLDNIIARVNNAEQLCESVEMADKILCDVPCSGFGIIRRKPEIRYKELDSVKDLPEIQYKILSVSSKYLKSGGQLVYSTCTLNKKENEKVVERFLSENADFSLVYEKTCFPSEKGGDGFYYAVTVKKNG